MDPSPAPAEHSRNDVRMDGVYFVGASADGPFVGSLEAGNFAYCVMLRSGRLRLETDFPSSRAFDLGPGDAVAVSGLTPHVFRAPGTGEEGPRDDLRRRLLTEADPTAAVDLILGVAPNEGLALGSLMVGPIVVRPEEHPDLSRRLWRAAEMLEDEYADDSCVDRDLVIRRLAEIMLVNMTRRALADGRDAANDATQLPGYRPIVHAINAVLAAPDRPWTLSHMARAAGMSRTRFASEFKVVTGQTPGRIVSRMRLTAVARRLVVEAVSVEAAADGAGYSSSAAFVRAFQREFGETPARWRRRRATLSPEAWPLAPGRAKAEARRSNPHRKEAVQ